MNIISTLSHGSLVSLNCQATSKSPGLHVKLTGPIYKNYHDYWLLLDRRVINTSQAVHVNGNLTWISNLKGIYLVFSKTTYLQFLSPFCACWSHWFHHGFLRVWLPSTANPEASWLPTSKTTKGPNILLHLPQVLSEKKGSVHHFSVSNLPIFKKGASRLPSTLRKKDIIWDLRTLAEVHALTQSTKNSGAANNQHFIWQTMFCSCCGSVKLMRKYVNSSKPYLHRVF